MKPLMKYLQPNSKKYFIVATLLILSCNGSDDLDLVDIVTFDGVGAEKFAEHAFNFADKLIREKTDNRCYVVSVECAEHGANSAIYSIE